MTSAITASGSVTRNTEPQSNCSSSAPESSGPSDEIAPPSPDQSAIDLVRAGPDQSAVISASVVGNAIPAASPPSTRATNRTSIDGAKRGEQAGRDRERHAEDQHQLAPVAVADRAQVEHRGREPERVADRDQVERRLAGVEGLADVGQSDVGDREVQVRDRGDEDQAPRARPRRASGRRVLMVGRAPPGHGEHRGDGNPARTAQGRPLHRAPRRAQGAATAGRRVGHRRPLAGGDRHLRRGRAPGRSGQLRHGLARDVVGDPDRDHGRLRRRRPDEATGRPDRSPSC